MFLEGRTRGPESFQILERLRMTYLDLQLIILEYENSGLNFFNGDLRGLGDLERLNVEQIALPTSDTSLVEFKS